MAQVKLTLRPPPNVDFVHGYPGIPSGGGDRPQAAVKGAIEVRVSPQGIKAKWVRVELRKVETLPGGGPANTFYDFVGPSPVNLWQATEDYALLQTQDFPFSIRIPESVPPSIALENRAGIKYELLATVCTLGKRGFFRTRKSIVVSTMAPIMIDKHELHSTWPIYGQPESRHMSQDEVNLTVDRTQTCFGPGDRVQVLATLKSDSLHNVILRGFELHLKESVIYRAGHAAIKRGAAQVRTQTIGEHRFLVNITLYGGTSHKAELFCDISPAHTTTSLNTARHIDVNYVLSVKALMGTGTHLVMDLPVIISNWPRAVSIEAVRRIGPAPSLSLTGDPKHQQQVQAQVTKPIPPKMNNGQSTAAASARNPSATVSIASPRQSTDPAFGRGANGNAVLGKGGVNGNGNTAPGRMMSATGVDEMGYSTGGASRPNTGMSTVSRPRSAGTASVRTLAVTNHSESLGTTDGGGGGGRGAWPNADEEKRALFVRAAKAEADRTQAKATTTLAVVDENSGSPSSLEEPAPTKPKTQPQPQPQSPAQNQNQNPPRATHWPTAEEEKLRLFNEAQALAARTQQAGFTHTPPSQTHMRRGSDLINGAGPSTGSSAPPVPLSPGGRTDSIGVGAMKYSQAMAAASAKGLSSVNKYEQAGYFPNMNTVAGSVHSPPSRAPVMGPGPGAMTSPKKSVPTYPSAEEEKAALRRYHEAKVAVDRTQGTDFVNGSQSFPGPSSTPASAVPPAAYSSIYPSTSGGPSLSGFSGGDGGDLPPPFESRDQEMPTYMNEKERLRRAYAAQDEAAARSANSSPRPAPPVLGTSTPALPYLGTNGVPVSTSTPPHTFSSPSPSKTPPSGPKLSEKEILRRKYEVQDGEAAGATSGPALGGGSAPMPPPPRVGRAPPVPPANAGAVRSAAEEKALLRAKYEAEDRLQQQQQQEQQRVPPMASGSASKTNGYRFLDDSGGYASASGSSSAPPPPPLMPRPPSHYIQQTQEEDERVSRYLSHDTVTQYANEAGLDDGKPVGGERGYAGYESGVSGVFGRKSGPRPPLPPKLPFDN